MTDKEISVTALKNRIEFQLVWTVDPMFKKRHIKIGDEVYACLYDALLVFMKSVIRNLARHKKKYDIICPLLKPLRKNRTGNKREEYEVKTLYDETPYTATDMFECFKVYPNIIPRRNIYQVYLLYITQAINGRNPRRRKRKNSEED